MKASTPEIYLDEIDAMEAQTRWALDLDSLESPFREEVHPHVGEGGATTAYYQNARLVGVASRIRDEFNRTILVCVDFRLLQEKRS